LPQVTVPSSVSRQIGIGACSATLVAIAPAESNSSSRRQSPVARPRSAPDGALTSNSRPRRNRSDKALAIPGKLANASASAGSTAPSRGRSARR
jgi:hypothetical protein